MICLYKSQIINNGFQNLSHLSCIWYQKIFHSSYLFCHISQIYMFHIIHQISQHISQTMNHISCHVSKLNHFRISHFHIIYMCVCVCVIFIYEKNSIWHILYITFHFSKYMRIIPVYIYMCITFVYLIIYMPHVHANSGHALIRRFCQNTKTHTL